MPNPIEEIVKEFDEKFGTPVTEEDGFGSNGRTAGCDDCKENVKLREEHKSFLRSSLLKVRSETLREVRERVEKLRREVKYEGGTDIGKVLTNGAEAFGFNTALDSLLASLDKE